MRRYTKKKAFDAFAKVIKSAMTEHPDRHELHCSWIGEDGLQYVCDAFRAYRLGGIGQPEYLDGLPETNVPRRPSPDVSIVFQELEKGNVSLVECPSVDEFAKRIKEHRENKLVADEHWHEAYDKLVYDFLDNLPQVRASFLMEALTLFPDGKVFVINCPDPTHRPIFVKSDYGEACIFPVSKRRHK